MSQIRSRLSLTPFLFLLAFVAASLVAPVPASSQEVTASITGTVTDPTGAAVSGAKVTATDVQRGVPYSTQTNTAGVYDLPRLPVSTYDVNVEMTGFQTVVQKGIVLELNQTARVDFKLQLGLVTQTVEVTAAPPLLSTDTIQVGTIINSKINQDLPLATRNYVELTLLAPGVTNPNPSGFTNGQPVANGARPYVNGNREQSDNFLLDGMDNNQVSDNLVGYTPSVDAIQEFNLITNNAPADFGNFQGGIVSATIKSGTNQLHGSGFEFFRNDVLNAAEWSQNIAKAPGTPDTKTKIRWNMFGGSMGGPIKKDKLFFFGDYQGERFDTPSSTSFITVFTAKERAGDFSEICSTFDSTGKCTNGIQLYNAKQVDAKGNRALVPYNNLAAAGLTIDPVAANLFSKSYYPAPINGSLRNNQLNSNGTETVADQFDIKVDANASEKDRVFGRFSWGRQEIPGFNSFLLFMNSFQHTPTDNVALNWTRSINPSLVNEVRLGYNYVKLNNGSAANSLGNVGTDLGIAGGNDRGPGLNSLQGFTYASSLGAGNSEQLFADTVIQAEDALVITHNRHTLHTGFQYLRQRINTFYAGNYGLWGIINFDGRFTAGPANTATSSATSGFPEADFWLGLPEAVQRGIDTGTWGQRANVFAPYVQDNWRVTSDLTLNLGLRYETHTPWGEVHDRQANFGEITGTEYFAGKGGCAYNNCNALYNSYNAGFDFQPRIGFAWTPSRFGKSTVIRGAYTASTYLEGTGTNLRLPLNPPFAEEHNTLYDPYTYPKSTTGQGFTVLTSPTDPFANAVIRLWNPDVKPSLAQQWNLSIQHEFSGQTCSTSAMSASTQLT